MPWTTPDLPTVRTMARNFVTAALRAASIVANSVTRIVTDATAGLAYLCLLYIDWLANQLLPDTAEDEWLDRHANIWLTNADGSRGRKLGTYAVGTVTMTGTYGTPVPYATQFTSGAVNADGTAINFQTMQQATLDVVPVTVQVRALSVGVAGNLPAGTNLNLATGIPGVDGQAPVVSLTSGTDKETNDEVRARVLERIRNPPMGGDAEDYVAWALDVAGVTRAWLSPGEMGPGTVTLRFMCDELRSSNGGFPLPQDVAAVTAYLNTVRPVTVLDMFVEAPIPEPINFTVLDLDPDDDPSGIQASIATSVAAMLQQQAAPAYAKDGVAQPAQTIFAVWVSDAIYNTAGVVSFDLQMADHPMPSNGSMAVLGTILFE